MSAYDIPTSITIDGTTYGIRNKGDYRMVLDCFAALGDAELTKEERVLSALIIFYEDINDLTDIAMFNDIEKAVSEMYTFFNCGKLNKVGTQVPFKLLDWDGDAQLVSSAINKVAGKEVRSEPYVHWWTFMGYYTSIGDCPLTVILNIRNKMMRDKKLEKAEREFKNNNPEYFEWNSATIEQQEAEDWVKSVWNQS